MTPKLRLPFNGDFKLTQGFGHYSQDVINQFHLDTAYSQLHWGLDYGLPIGSEVVASDSGIVKFIGEDSRSGKYIIIDHGNGFMTHYYHLNEYLVKPLQEVSRGQSIARSGNSGMTTGPHLHFQLNINGNRVDPTPFFGEYEQKPVGGDIGASAPIEPVKDEIPVSNAQPNMKLIGNTGSASNPGPWNTLGAICHNLGLPLNPNSYEKILLWNPWLRNKNSDNSTNYNIIPSNKDIFVPSDFNAQPIQPVAPVPQVETLRTVIVSRTENNSLSAIYAKYFNGVWNDHNTQKFLDFISTHNAPQGFNKNNPGHIEVGWKFTIPNSL